MREKSPRHRTPDPQEPNDEAPRFDADLPDEAPPAPAPARGAARTGRGGRRPSARSRAAEPPSEEAHEPEREPDAERGYDAGRERDYEDAAPRGEAPPRDRDAPEEREPKPDRAFGRASAREMEPENAYDREPEQEPERAYGERDSAPPAPHGETESAGRADAQRDPAEPAEGPDASYQGGRQGQERPRFDRDRNDRDRNDRDRNDRDRNDRDRNDRDRNDRPRFDRERADRDRPRFDRDRNDRDRNDRPRFDRDRNDRDRFDRDRHDRDRNRQGRGDRDRFDRFDRGGRSDRPDRPEREERFDRGGPPEPPPPPLPKLYPLAALQAMTVKDLHPVAQELGLVVPAGRKKHAVISMIMEEQVRRAGREMTEGILEILPDGYGFLRSNSYYTETGDVYVSPSQVKRLGLRSGDTILGQVRHAKEGEKYAALVRIESINNEDPDKIRTRKTFEKLVPLYPEKKIEIEVIGEADISCRVMDLFCPIGKGQRGLIVAPPKAGKTTLLKSIANAITTNHPEITLMVLLIDERPEEVTDMQRSIDGEVVSSTFDEPIERHIQVSKLILEKAKRLVEMDKDVVILLDSITRLARAYNLVLPSTGQTLSGGVNPAALYLPKKFFGAARYIENGGSLTIIATALVDTGSRLDDVIFEEFKGTGNLELVLDRKLFEKRIFPCMDIKKTGTRKEELLLDKETLRKLWVLRKIVDPLSPAELMQLLIDRIGKTKSNAEFLASMHAQES